MWQFLMNARYSRGQRTCGKNLVCKGVFSLQKNFIQYPTHQIFGHMHRALNTVKNN